MSWTYRYAPKIQPTQEFPDAALMEDDAETILDPVPKINAAPAHLWLARDVSGFCSA